ncbi:MAG TPA: AAA family ATPase, partial [Planctomycetaceae bacterium]|nr:AAA family ATPase [Planctomycetaceae bacterium]
MPLSTSPNQSNHLASLNPAQREAASTLSGPLLVLAGAGTGKTRVITYRMVELIRNGIAPDKILSVTFTNKAAKEMQGRMAALLGKRLPAKPFISTFHSLCVRILREEISLLGYPGKFVIYDRGDQESAARTALREIRVTDKSLRPGDLLNRISTWKMA